MHLQPVRFIDWNISNRVQSIDIDWSIVPFPLCYPLVVLMWFPLLLLPPFFVFVVAAVVVVVSVDSIVCDPVSQVPESAFAKAQPTFNPLSR